MTRETRGNCCPGCGTWRRTRNPEAYCHTCRKGTTSALSPAGIAWMLQEAARTRGAQLGEYARAKAERRPWISIQEAAHELDVSEGRISQLIANGTFLAQKDPDRPRAKQVLAAEVYEYKPTPTRKRAAA